MEVHKHPHHVMHEKKWGEYLLEFFMLFLAVFLGFLAENFREHQLDKTKEKEYMVSLMSDLSKDSSSINTSITINKILIHGYDSTLDFLTHNLHNGDTAELALLYFYRYCTLLKLVRINDGTIMQLKNSGALRLLRNKDVINKVNSYYNEILVIKSTEASVNDFMNIIARQAGEIFNYRANKTLVDSSNLEEGYLYEIPLNEMKNWLTHGSPTMLTTELKALAPFMSNISFEMGLIHNYISQLKRQKEKGAELLLEIKNAYDLKNE